MNTRRTAILKYLSRRGQAKVHELAEFADVSVVTMRQDLAVLEQEGFINRFHGGATLSESENISHRMSINYEKKRDIAMKAAELVESGDTILLESSSANALLARELAGRRIQVLSVNAFVARQIRPGDAAQVVMLGGLYQPESESLVGTLAKQCIESTYFSKAFLGIDGFTPDFGFTNRDMMRAEVATLIVSRCPQSYILADSSKFGHTGIARVCGLDDLAGVITNADLHDDYKSILRQGSAQLFLT